jgi:hypothetical protein
MATQAQIRPGAAQISGDIAAVGLMTCTATLFGEGLVFMGFLPRALIRMAAVAHRPFRLIEEKRMFAGVGLMAVAAAPFFKGDMPETGLVLRGTVFVTLQAALGLRLLQQRGMLGAVGRMTCTALALEQRRMYGCGRHIEADTAVTFGTEFILGTCQQPRRRGIVKQMTGAALLLLHRRMLHAGICRRIGMAFHTHLTLRRAQQMVRPRSRLVGSVAFKAVTLSGIGMMGAPLIQTGMTFKTQITLFTFQECRTVAGMGHVTRGAITLHYGGMPISLTCLLLHFGVAAQTQALLGCLKCEGSALMTGGTRT